jgi:flagellar biosynthetic protein FlhB
MAEDQDGDKTEEPSQKRLDDARAKGQVPLSRDVSHALILATAAGLVVLAVPALGVQVLSALRWFLQHASAPAGEVDEIRSHMLSIVFSLAGVAAVPAAAFAIAGILSTVGQQGLLWSTDNLAPKAERLSPISGFTRMFGGPALVEFAKNMAKVIAIGAVCWIELQGELPALVEAVARQPVGIGQEIARLIGRVLMICAVAAGCFGIIDVAWQRFRFHRKMRMTRQDLKDEMKQSEGDPVIKQRLRAIRMARARMRMMADIPKSTVVITNPTHYAVALRYEKDEHAAPVVMAKGVDHLAAIIRAKATEHGVPIIENPPLARALHAMAEIGRPIPVVHYRAVAEVIATVMKLRRGHTGPATAL